MYSKSRSKYIKEEKFFSLYICVLIRRIYKRISYILEKIYTIFNILYIDLGRVINICIYTYICMYTGCILIFSIFLIRLVRLSQNDINGRRRIFLVTKLN